MRATVAEIYESADEETITKLFYEELSRVSRKLSDRKIIANTFLEDLKYHLGSISDSSVLSTIARGLVVRVTMHNRRTEGKTGGDLGVAVSRPQLIVDRNQTKIVIGRDHLCGVLCQAKLQKASGKWGRVSKSQEVVLAEKLEFAALILYSYEDSSRRLIAPFAWKPCRGLSVGEIKKMLASGKFGDTVRSGSAIQLLGNAQIGTEDPGDLASFVSPVGNQTLLIEITWASGASPGPPGTEIPLRTDRLYTQVTNTVRY